MCPGCWIFKRCCSEHSTLYSVKCYCHLEYWLETFFLNFLLKLEICCCDNCNEKGLWYLYTRVSCQTMLIFILETNFTDVSALVVWLYNNFPLELLEERWSGLPIRSYPQGWSTMVYRILFEYCARVMLHKTCLLQNKLMALMPSKRSACKQGLLTGPFSRLQLLFLLFPFFIVDVVRFFFSWVLYRKLQTCLMVTSLNVRIRPKVTVRVADQSNVTGMKVWMTLEQDRTWPLRSTASDRSSGRSTKSPQGEGVNQT